MMYSLRELVVLGRNFNHRLIMVMETLGVIALIIIMVTTFSDVIGAKLFLHPVPGSIDIVMVAQIIAISFGVASTLIAGGHVKVEFFLVKMPKGVRRMVGAVVDILCLFLFLLIAWRLAVYGYQVYHEGEMTPTAHIPLYPFAFGITLAMLPVCIELSLKIFERVLDKKIHS